MSTEPSTPAPTPTVTIEPTPTIPPEAFNGVSVTTEPSSQGGIVVTMKYADGAPKSNARVRIYEQKTDISSNPIRGNQLAEGRTEDNGSVFFALEPGVYAVALYDYAGQPWGNEFNYEVAADQLTHIDMTFGRLSIGVIDVDGKAMEGRKTYIYLQKNDISGNPILDDRIAEARTDNTGLVFYDLSPGLYGVDIRDIGGYPWKDLLNHPVLPGQTNSLLLQLGRLSVGVRNADGQGLQDKRVRVYLQKQDVGGNIIKGDRVLDGYTDNTGAISWNVMPGTYAVEISGVAGNLWGEELNHEANSNEPHQITLTLGRLAVALKDAAGAPIINQRVRVYYQTTDVGGNITRGDRFLDGYTSDTGLVSWDVTEGNYIIEVDNIGTLMDVPVRSGVVTITDGDTILEGP